MDKLLYFFIAFFLLSKNFAQTQEGIPMPAWLDSSVIYEVNVRQYTEKGTFLEFKKHLPRLKKMGIDILWFMPVYPISKIKRKGSLGSYYSIASYLEVNEEFGSSEDFRSVVNEAHQLGMKVILDWVPNHTGWSHPWIQSHADWYTKDPATDTIIHAAGTDWFDVADLNYENKNMRIEMIRSMLYWLDTYNVDGFRCDVAMMVPDDFWLQFSRNVRSMNKSIFMLAEAEESQHRNRGLFHADYGWTFQNLIHEIANGTKSAIDFVKYIEEDSNKFEKGFHMYFTTNHDENSWKGTEFETLGSAHQLFSALTFVLDGIPLIYSGQEEPLKKRLRFFDKDTIGFKNFVCESFFKNLITLRKNNPALYAGSSGGKINWIETDVNKNILAFKRTKDQNEVICFFNLSEENQTTKIKSKDLNSEYIEFNSKKKQKLSEGTRFKLNSWEYKIFIKE